VENSETLQIPTSIRLDRETQARIEALANEEQRSFSNMLRVLISEGIAVRTGAAGAASNCSKEAAA